ncbi:MAG: iron-containing alcohol dehydrogenase [Ruminiclostridium sp.]|nr:iron-containing alcohol dehydrogenase [Ruminiclostridium sp.]
MHQALSFKFTHTPDLLFGVGKINMLPGLLHDRKVQKIVLVTGGSSFQKTDHWVRLSQELSGKGISFFPVSVHREPSPGFVDDITEKYRGVAIDVVVSIGGGSVIDAGKALSAMLTQQCSVMDFLEGAGNGLEHDGRKVPFIAVPTTSGTGSEATKNAVLSQIGENGFKNSLRHDNFVPDLAILDPELTVSCPPNVTAASGMDAFCQLLEAYMSDASSPMTDALALSGLEFAAASLEDVSTAQPHHLEKRARMSYAAFLSGITLANAGLGVVHGFASSIGGLFDIPHGVLCGTMLPEAVQVSVQEAFKDRRGNAGVIRKYITLTEVVCGTVFTDDAKTCSELVNYLFRLKETLKLPGLSKYAVSSADAVKIASKTSNKNNPVKLNREQLSQLVISCL